MKWEEKNEKKVSQSTIDLNCPITPDFLLKSVKMSWTAFEFVSHVQGKQQLSLLRQIHYFCLRLHKWMGSPLCPRFYAKFQNFWQKRDLSKQVSCIFIGSSRPWRHFLIGNARKLLMSEKAVNVLMSTNSLVPQETAAWRNPISLQNVTQIQLAAVSEL